MMAVTTSFLFEKDGKGGPYGRARFKFSSGDEIVIDPMHHVTMHELLKAISEECVLVREAERNRIIRAIKAMPEGL